MADPVTSADTAPPYTSFMTLMNTIERMADEGGVPSRVDRSYLSNMPGSVRATFITSLKAMGLIGDDLRPSSKLVELVEADGDGRKTTMLDMVHERYPEPLSLGKMATQSQLEEVFRGYGVSGSTLRKAIGFFLHAARYAGVPLSPHFKLPKRTPEASRVRPVKAVPQRLPDTADEAPAPGPAPKADPLAELDPFIVGLVRALPEPGGVFSERKQDAWFDTARGIFKLIYKSGAPDDDPEPVIRAFVPRAGGGDSN